MFLKGTAKILSSAFFDNKYNTSFLTITINLLTEYNAAKL